MISLIVLARSWLIAALPVLATVGPHCLPIAAFGVSIYGFRLLLMLLALFSTPLNTRAKWWFNPVARWAIFFGAFWLFYGLLSLFWAPDRNSGLGEIVTIVFGFTLILALFSLEAYRPDHLDKLRFGWLIAFLLAAMVGWLEILTDRHLPSPRAEHNLDYFTHSKIVSTMSHTSNFGGFLLLVVPFLIWSMEKAKGPAKLAYIAMIGAVGHLMFYTASRIGLLGLIAQLAIYVVVLNRRWYTILLLALGALVAFGYWTHMSSRGELAVARKMRSAESGTDASIDHRLALTLNGLYMVYKTAGRGWARQDSRTTSAAKTSWCHYRYSDLGPGGTRITSGSRSSVSTAFCRLAHSWRSWAGLVCSGGARSADRLVASPRWWGAAWSWHWSVTCFMARQGALPWSNRPIGCFWPVSS